MITETLERPRTSRELTAAHEWELRQEEAREAAMAEVMTGNGPFWAQIDQHRWDADQEMFIFAALRFAVADKSLSAEEFRELVLESVRQQAERYAAEAAHETL